MEANLSSFLALSELYNLVHLKSQVQDSAIKNLTVGNVVEMFSLANLHNAGTLSEATKIFIMKNKMVLRDQDLSQIPPSVLTELFKLVTQS